MLLKKHQIKTVQALEGVGGNLHDHLQLRMQYKVKNVRTLNEMANSLFGKAMMGLDYAFRRRGPLALSVRALHDLDFGKFCQRFDEALRAFLHGGVDRVVDDRYLAFAANQLREVLAEQTPALLVV